MQVHLDGNLMLMLGIFTYFPALLLHTVSPTEPGTLVLAKLHSQEAPRIILFPQLYTEVTGL